MNAVINFYQQNRVSFDVISDYIPGVSSLTNLIDIFQKYAFSSSANEGVANPHAERYYEHLKEKSFVRCVLLLIPLIGNIIAACFDVTIALFRMQAIDYVRSNGLNLRLIDDRFKNDPQIVLEAVSQNGLALLFAGESLRNNFAIVKRAYDQNPESLQHAGHEATLQIVAEDGLALRYADYNFRNDPEVVRIAYNGNPRSLAFAGEDAVLAIAAEYGLSEDDIQRLRG